MYLTHWTNGTRDFLLAHPWMLEINRYPPPMGPRSMRWIDRALGVLRSAGLDDHESLNAPWRSTGYVFSQAALDGHRDRRPPRRGTFHGDEYSAEHAFEFGLKLLLDGIQALVIERFESGAR